MSLSDYSLYTAS